MPAPNHAEAMSIQSNEPFTMYAHVRLARGLSRADNPNGQDLAIWRNSNPLSTQTHSKKSNEGQVLFLYIRIKKHCKKETTD